MIREECKVKKAGHTSGYQLFISTYYFKIIYLIFSLCSAVPLMSKIIAPIYKIIVVYGFMIIICHGIKKKFSSNRYFIPFFIFLYFILLSIIANMDRNIFFNIKNFAYTIVSILILTQPEESKELALKRQYKLNRIFITISYIIVGISLFLYLKNYSQGYYIDGIYYILGLYTDDRLYGIANNSTQLSAICAIAIALIIFNSNLNKVKIRKQIFKMLPFIFCIVLVDSRGMTFSFFVFVSVYLFGNMITHKGDNGYILKSITKNCLILFIMLMLIPGIKVTSAKMSTFYLNIENSIKSRVVENVGPKKSDKFEGGEITYSRRDDEKSKGGSGRFLIWRVSYDIIKDNFLMGVGIGSIPDYFTSYVRPYNPSDDDVKMIIRARHNTHNAFIQTQLTYGIFTFIMYLFLLFMISKDMLKKCLSKSENQKTYIIIFAILGMLAAHELFEVRLVYYLTFENFIFLSFLSVFLTLHRNNDKENRSIGKKQ